jgi:hypothetical protein
MARGAGAAARRFDFGEASASGAGAVGPAGRAMLRLAAPGRLRGPDKYAVLERQRRRAQIRARRLLDLIDAEESR